MAKAKKLPSGNWHIKVYSHTETLPDGKRKKIRVPFTHPDKAEVEFMAAEDVRNKTRRKTPANLTVGEALDAYIAKSDGLLSPTTITGYKKIRKNRFTDLMGLSVGKLSAATLKEAVNAEAKKPVANRKDGRVLSSKTLLNAYRLILAAIKPYRKDLYEELDISIPAPQQPVKKLLLPDEIIGIVKGAEIELAVMLAMWLSFSMSEIRGLTRSKSLWKGYIIVEDVLVDVEGKPFTKDRAKAEKRQRMHKIPPYIQELIEKTDQTEDRLVPLSGQAIYKRFARMLSAAGKQHMTFHDLRHVNASVMAMLGVPDKYAQERGGWKTDHVMKRVYQHTFDAYRQQVDDTVDSYFASLIPHEIPHSK